MSCSRRLIRQAVLCWRRLQRWDGIIPARQCAAVSNKVLRREDGDRGNTLKIIVDFGKYQNAKTKMYKKCEVIVWKTT